ncbi:hypothetical protein BD410DRAFT_400542 [Rickenella mellea]|uniref:Uncharacterized protein n=1 Tax=Rickenella mellea TaxID=50990 RepID=A0A4Y7PX09_9AGAM|nr:hypothetical protein BD410DRAFT_400542 [Rickenella mellea]
MDEICSSLYQLTLPQTILSNTSTAITTTMSSPSSSTSQLVSSSSSTTSSVPQKDFSSSFGMLQSTYGLSGSVPTPISSQPQLPTMKSSKPGKFSRFFGSRSRSENVTVSPNPSPSSSSSPQKDFEASFGQLQSQYGLGGPFYMTKSGSKK